MEKGFIPYEQVLELDKLGFNFYSDYIRVYEDQTGKIFNPDFAEHSMNDLNDYRHNKTKNYVRMITFSQAFKWFREKYKLHGFIENTCVQDGDTYHAYINSTNVGIIGLKSKRLFNMFDFKTYEEAELTCLKKLIEIVKTK